MERDSKNLVLNTLEKWSGIDTYTMIQVHIPIKQFRGLSLFLFNKYKVIVGNAGYSDFIQIILNAVFTKETC